MKESIRCDLENYIVNNILPQYRNFDKAHGQEHIEQVIAKSLFWRVRPEVIGKWLM